MEDETKQSRRGTNGDHLTKSPNAEICRPARQVVSNRISDGGKSCVAVRRRPRSTTLSDALERGTNAHARLGTPAAGCPGPLSKRLETF